MEKEEFLSSINKKLGNRKVPKTHINLFLEYIKYNKLKEGEPTKVALFSVPCVVRNKILSRSMFEGHGMNLLMAIYKDVFYEIVRLKDCDKNIDQDKLYGFLFDAYIPSVNLLVEFKGNHKFAQPDLNYIEKLLVNLDRMCPIEMSHRKPPNKNNRVFDLFILGPDASPIFYRYDFDIFEYKKYKAKLVYCKDCKKWGIVPENSTTICSYCKKNNLRRFNIRYDSNHFSDNNANVIKIKEEDTDNWTNDWTNYIDFFNDFNIKIPKIIEYNELSDIYTTEGATTLNFITLTSGRSMSIPEINNYYKKFKNTPFEQQTVIQKDGKIEEIHEGDNIISFISPAPININEKKSNIKEIKKEENDNINDNSYYELEYKRFIKILNQAAKEFSEEESIIKINSDIIILKKGSNDYYRIHFDNNKIECDYKRKIDV